MRRPGGQVSGVAPSHHITSHQITRGGNRQAGWIDGLCLGCLLVTDYSGFPMFPCFPMFHVFTLLCLSVDRCRYIYIYIYIYVVASITMTGTGLG